MALRKSLSERLFDGYRTTSHAVSLEYPLIYLKSTIPPPNPAKTNFHREYLTSPGASGKGFFQRFLHRRAINQLPEFLSAPVGEKLREGLKGINITKDRLRLDEVAPPTFTGDVNLFGISVQDARKVLRISQVEKLKARLREIPKSSVLYSEFVQICVEECGNEDQGIEFAKMLDQSATVIVLGNIVFLRPEQVAKSMENIISQSIAIPNDPKRKHLEHMELQKAIIDQKARAQVKGELYCGLGFMVAQTLGFMRLTFWELSWDVMEPICFFVTSLHFALAYVFFLRTSVEPSFEGYFQRRFKAKQRKLMKIHNFDIENYNKLRKAFYPNINDGFPRAEHYKPFGGEDEMLLKLK
ncbi:calcium uniporter protein 4, mitochondrial [Ricinus communis]|uniref:Calcium uniporter protein C-terminal domain-containing protein n=1 Tax=Ricinus communis TaxID=3988 RepID=B9R7P9_RICCO|nr:calcium uniporter protein 4, mitochondrial [Ricinus communis]EEF52529.1 conserved hypothetical protein [Ricinus communis]|eukprot:XP_002510342.1 calcium uniporter protein 4, mitochondrial [Ricinus communis]